MARIEYDCYLCGGDSLVTITNADTDGLATTAPESFTRPPMKMEFLDTGYTSFEELCLRSVNRDEITIPDEDVLLMVRGELPGWRLVGAEFALDRGFSVYYANEYPLAASMIDGKRRYTAAEGVSFFFVEHDCLEVELTVDYGDGLPPRRYIGKVTENSDMEISTEIIEFLGKRKVRRIAFSEGERGDEHVPGHLCHITEY